MTSQTAPASIHKLVETFEQNLDSYRSTKNETELRREFLDKFFAALGWDVANEKAYDEQGKEVVHEFSVEVSGQQKKADYAFRVGRGDRFDFLVEAKKPSVKIESNQDAAFQIRRYGWSAKLPINILTDFEHFAVYDCRAKPSYNDKASTGRILLIHYKEYVERWDEIAAIFSPEAVRQGSFAKYAEGIKGKRGTADVDDAFLQEIERWRELLAKNIALRNEKIDIAGLNYAVQMTIDRIVFLRICEERGIEPENQLQDIIGSDGVYAELSELFKRADTKYNSGLFHFKQEKEQASRADDLTLDLDIDDKVLKDIISNLYYPKSPYAFLYIPADILGQVYERFLGKVIRLTAGHNAKVEEKPEVRKAGGVYYTPTYIVDYIVKNTVGRIINSTYTPKEVAKLKIVDPACGSGTFLLGAYQFLLDWHLNWYVNDDAEKWVKQKALTPAPLPAGEGVRRTGEGGYRLTTSKKKEILLNNIHGVDIDAQAVEVTKLSLLLKVLENASGQLGLGMERVLPDLGNNIKCGNSLIGFDYFEGQLSPDEEERARVNPFDWKNEFPQVFQPQTSEVSKTSEVSGRNGFDVVIGNPPYGAELTNDDIEYLRKKFSVAEYQLDTYPLFIEKSLLSVRQKGYCGFIIPSAWTASKFDKNFRQFLLSKTKLQNLVVTPKRTFEDAVVETLILTFTNELALDSIFSIERWDKDEHKIYQFTQNDISKQEDFVFPVYASPAEVNLVSKIRASKIELSEYADAVWGVKIYQIGKGKPAQKGYESEEKIFHSEKKTKATHKPLIGGSGIKRYEINWRGGYVDYGQWLAEPRTPDWFSGTRILIREVTANGIIQAAVTDTDFVFSNSVDGLRLKNKKVDIRFMLGILNSKLISFYHLNTSANAFKGAFPKVLIKDLLKIPLPKVTSDQHDKMVSLVEAMLALHKSLAVAQSPAEKERLERQIRVTDREIDGLVYELYGLSEEEIKIVEGGE